MAQPKGLKWNDRIAVHGGKAYFDCHRGHPAVRRVFAHRSDARDFRTDHDAEYHRPNGGTRRREESIRVGALLERHLAHFADLVERGVKHWRTLKNYRLYAKHLAEGLKRTVDVADIGNPEIAAYVKHRFETSATQGATIIKELKYLRTAISWHLGDSAIRWRLPADEINPPKRERHHYSAEQWGRFLSELAGEARAIVVLKLRTGFRNVEIEELRVGDLSWTRDESGTLTGGVIRLMLHSKVNPIENLWPIPADLAGMLLPFTENKLPGAYVFATREIRNLKRHFIEASKRAEINPPITAIGQGRHHVITWLSNTYGTAATAQGIGHRVESTTARYILSSGNLKAKAPLASHLAEMFPVKQSGDHAGDRGGTGPAENQWKRVEKA